MTTKAYLRKPNRKGQSPLCVWYTHKREWFAVSTGMAVAPEHFDKESGIVSRACPHYKLINAVTEKLRSKLMECAYKLLLQGHEPTVELVSAVYKGQDILYPHKREGNIIRTGNHPEVSSSPSFLYPHKREGSQIGTGTPIRALLDLYAKGSQDVSANTVKQWNLLRNNLVRFAETRNEELTFEGMDLAFFERYSDYLLNDLDYYNNSWHKNVCMLKGFLNWCQDRHGVTTVNPAAKKWKSYPEEKEIVYLNPDELDLLYNYEWDEVRRKYVDLFVLTCDTGFRISDVFRSRMWAFDNGVIYTTTKKTKGSARVPVSPRITEILMRYGHDMRIATEQKANKYIKECCEQIGLTKEVTILRYKRKREYESTARKCDLVTMHSGRRSFITNCFAKGMSEIEILQMIGSKDLRTMKKYLKVEMDNIKAKMAA